MRHDELLRAASSAFESVDLPDLGAKTSGKVRDIYVQPGRRILISTDRVSAFDRVLGLIPYRGQVLNQLSAWWFEQCADIVNHHLIDVPDPNVSVVHEAEMIPVEVVVRGYITGVTNTSLWTLYEAGDRQPYGVSLPDGLRKNDPLPEPIITPTTKAAGGAHDERITRDEIIGQGIVSVALWERIEAAALALFARGQARAQEVGLLLVDTKYEFGLIGDQLTLIDELHTPDSSRYWTASSYERAREQGGQPQSMSKEFLREWYALRGYKGEGDPPPMNVELAAMVAGRYISVYEALTGASFTPGEQPIAERIARHLEPYRI